MSAGWVWSVSCRRSSCCCSYFAAAVVVAAAAVAEQPGQLLESLLRQLPQLPSWPGRRLKRQLALVGEVRRWSRQSVDDASQPPWQLQRAAAICCRRQQLLPWQMWPSRLLSAAATTGLPVPFAWPASWQLEQLP